MLRNLQYKTYAPSSIKPEGWLKKQLTLQAEGLAGNLDRLWPDIKDSMWIGGSRNDWERVPYWLDGFIPLAYLLDDEDMKARAKFYIDGIVFRQRFDGWICPCEDHERHHYDTWAVLLLCKVLATYCDLTGDENVEIALYRCLRHFTKHIDGATLHNWGAARWFEGLIPIFWLYERCHEDWLLLLAKKLNAQGFDWEKVFDTGMLEDLTDSWDYLSHVVNLAMMLKSRSLMSRLTGEDPDAFAKKALTWLQKNHGMATGHFTGDENLSGTSPVQGSELCSVVEAMYSFETLFSVSGNVYWLDMLEREGFNALPATFSPDLWTHQYVQLTNQVQCARTEKRVFRTNNEEAHIFGLEPHYGCCTANMGQGFPKLALSVFMETEKGVAACIPLPATLETAVKGVPVKVSCKSEYPFRGEVVYQVEAASPVTFDFSVRIPAGVKVALLNGKKVPSGSFFTLSQTFDGVTEITLSMTFTTRFEERPNGLYALWRGPLLYSLPIAERREMREYTAHGVERKFPYCDYYLYPESAWNYGFTDLDTHRIAVEELPFDAPFTPKAPPVALTLPMAKVKWAFPDGRCAPTPDDRKRLGEAEMLRLIPYGCTNLRMTEMPLLEK